ncbi:MAG: CCA tRNA nucleotidyltransferase, partial [Candidatus Hydrogenedentes bacterium]|nr:CCA tRNA nucleotidyltransferase [Candidatus Hydrogenedentota bacterium]
FEVATFRSDGPYEDGRHPTHVVFLDEKQDALRRDFTVNGLFYDPATEEIIDYVEGQADIERKVIRAVGVARERFQEDHLRLLRAVRFSVQLDYALDPETLEAVREHAHLIVKTSPERIRDELFKLLCEAPARRGIEMLDEAGLLRHILPEVTRMKGVEQPPEFHPEGDVYVHTLLALEKLEQPSITLAMATLLHDVGKPQTQTFEDRIRFNHHVEVGVAESKKICERLRLSNDQTERILWLVNQHMRVSATPDMRESKRKRLVREDGFAELLELFRVDCAASHNKMDTYEWLRDYAENLSPEETRPPPLLTGHDLIEMGYKPGKRFAEILHAVEDAQLDGTLTSSDDARRFVFENWPL